MAFNKDGQYQMQPAEVATLKTLAGTFNGFDNQQIADALNAPAAPVANPQPVPTIPRTIVARAAVQLFMTEVIAGLLRANSPLLPVYQYLQAQTNAYALDTFTPQEAQPTIAHAVADKVITQQQAASLLEMPDPSYSPTITLSPAAWYSFSVPLFLEASDIATALAS